MPPVIPCDGSFFGQFGQDQWVADLFGRKRNGTFLDIGCGDPIDINNTYLLERDYGWNGVSVDRKPIEGWSFKRKTALVTADVLDVDWPSLIKLCRAEKGLPSTFDYLSMDVDDDQMALVEQFPWDKIRFNAMTVEHGSYHYGDEVKARIRAILKQHGYKIARADIGIEDKPVDDWWVAEL